MRRTIVILALFSSTGCATNLSLLQSAETLDTFEVRPAVGVGVYLPVGQAQKNRKLAEAQAANLKAVQGGGGTVPDGPTQRKILELAASLAVLTPAPVVQGGARVGLVDGLDVGFAWTSSSWRLDAKLRLRGGTGKGVQVALLAGVELFTFDVGLFELDRYLQQDISPIFEYVKLTNPQRYDADLRLVFSGKIAKLFVPYAALEYRLGVYRLPITLTYQTPTDTFVFDETLAGTLHYGGLVGGLGFGPKLIRFFIELHAGYAYAPGTVLGSPADLGGAALYPAAGLAFTFF